MVQTSWLDHPARASPRPFLPPRRRGRGSASSSVTSQPAPRTRAPVGLQHRRISPSSPSRSRRCHTNRFECPKGLDRLALGPCRAHPATARGKCQTTAEPMPARHGDVATTCDSSTHRTPSSHARCTPMRQSSAGLRPRARPPPRPARRRPPQQVRGRTTRRRQRRRTQPQSQSGPTDARSSRGRHHRKQRPSAPGRRPPSASAPDAAVHPPPPDQLVVYARRCGHAAQCPAAQGKRSRCSATLAVQLHHRPRLPATSWMRPSPRAADSFSSPTA
jgi:hypothetical protein